MSHPRHIPPGPPREVDEPAGIASYVEAIRCRAQARMEQDAERCRRWRERLPRLVRELVAAFGATRIVLFGSLARGEAGLGSDIDLLVEGIDAEQVFAAAAAADRILGDVHVDLVPSAFAHPEVNEIAEREGEILYG